MENLVMLPQDLTYYYNKKVFVTGHTGFKGSWLLACLHRAGAIIKGYALAPEFEGVFSLLDQNISFESVISDIRDRKRLESELLQFQPNFIFHLAAQPLVRRSYEMPAYTYDVNVTGTANLLECAAKLDKCTIVIVTTDKVYENKEQGILYREDDRLGGYDPYSSSKACTEMVVSSFRSSFFNLLKFSLHGKALSTARAGNVIGGGDWSTDRLLPDIVRSLSLGEEISIRNPQSIRPWQFVLEPLSGYLRLGRLLDNDAITHSRPYNFGPEPGDHLKVFELVNEAIHCWGGGKWRDISNPDQLHEAGILQLDITSAKKDLKWHPRLNARQAVAWTIDWFKKTRNKQLDTTFQQIDEYFSL